jgi:hypothetical protein
MSLKEEVLKNMMAALEREPKIDLHHHPINADFSDGILTLEQACLHGGFPALRTY